MFIATEHIFVNQDRSKVVPAGSLEAAWLLAAPGQPVSNEDVVRYGLDKQPEEVEVEETKEEESKAEESAPENKAEDAPANDKAVKSPASKKAR